jgi:tRNA dimethylallyltransferase
MKCKTCIVVVGATATGKTAVALQLAGLFHAGIISSDSRQCFKEMSIGVAKPSVKELAQAKHYFISSHSIHDDVNAAVFEQYALQSVVELFSSNDIAIMVGGTGLYVKAFCEGLDDMPPVNPEIRAVIIAQFEQLGLPWLQQQVSEKDPLYYSTGEIQNPQRLIRALEVIECTGESIRTFQKGNKVQRDFNIIRIGLQLPKADLYRNINHRVDEMMKQGLLDEVTGLQNFRHLNALQTVGYTELFDHLEGKYELEDAVELIRKNTRHYAKRQYTWFRKDAGIHWFSPTAIEDIVDHCRTTIALQQAR